MEDIVEVVLVMFMFSKKKKKKMEGCCVLYRKVDMPEVSVKKEVICKHPKLLRESLCSYAWQPCLWNVSY